MSTDEKLADGRVVTVDQVLARVTQAEKLFGKNLEIIQTVVGFAQVLLTDAGHTSPEAKHLVESARRGEKTK